MTLVPADTDTADGADMLVAADWLNTPAEVCDYFRDPYKWQHLVAMWTAAGSPLPGGPGWELHMARLDAPERR